MGLLEAKPYSPSWPAVLKLVRFWGGHRLVGGGEEEPVGASSRTWVRTWILRDSNTAGRYLSRLRETELYIHL